MFYYLKIMHVQGRKLENASMQKYKNITIPLPEITC